MNADQMNAIVAAQTTTSAKIRALAAAGVKRDDIARFLNKRYQHIRNVLVDSELKTEANQGEPSPGVAREDKLYEDGVLKGLYEQKPSFMIGQETIREETAKRVRIDPMVKKAMAEAFAKELVRENIAVEQMIAQAANYLPKLEAISDTVFSRWASPIQGMS